jgi:hypothetical protein
VVGTAARSAYAAKNALGERCCFGWKAARIIARVWIPWGELIRGMDDLRRGSAVAASSEAVADHAGNRRNRGRRRVLARLGHDCPRDVIEVVARKIQLLCPLSLTAQFANAAAHEGILWR